MTGTHFTPECGEDVIIYEKSPLRLSWFSPRFEPGSLDPQSDGLRLPRDHIRHSNMNITPPPIYFITIIHVVIVMVVIL